MALILIQLLLVFAFNKFTICHAEKVCTATIDDVNCVFPFTYGENVFHQCTSTGGVYNAWCATTDNYDRDRKWGYCKIATYGGSADGGVCIFPFSYNGYQYRVCTSTGDRNDPWCETGDNKWGYCDMGCPQTEAASTEAYIDTTSTTINIGAGSIAIEANSEIESKIIYIGAVAGVSIGVGIIVIGTLAGVTLLIIYRRKQRNVKNPSTAGSDPPVYDDVNDKTKQGDTPPPRVDSQAQNDYEDVPMHDTVASDCDYYNITMVTGGYTGGDSGTDGDNNIYETTSTNIYVNDLGPDTGNVYQQLKKTK